MLGRAHKMSGCGQDPLTRMPKLCVIVATQRAAIPVFGRLTALPPKMAVKYAGMLIRGLLRSRHGSIAVSPVQ